MMEKETTTIFFVEYLIGSNWTKDTGCFLNKDFAEARKKELFKLFKKGENEFRIIKRITTIQRLQETV